MGDIYRNAPTKMQQENKKIRQQLIETQLALAQIIAENIQKEAASK